VTDKLHVVLIGHGSRTAIVI